MTSEVYTIIHLWLGVQGEQELYFFPNGKLPVLNIRAPNGWVKLVSQGLSLYMKLRHMVSPILDDHDSRAHFNRAKTNLCYL